MNKQEEEKGRAESGITSTLKAKRKSKLRILSRKIRNISSAIDDQKKN